MSKCTNSFELSQMRQNSLEKDPPPAIRTCTFLQQLEERGHAALSQYDPKKFAWQDSSWISCYYCARSRQKTHVGLKQQHSELASSLRWELGESVLEFCSGIHGYGTPLHGCYLILLLFLIHASGAFRLGQAEREGDGII